MFKLSIIIIHLKSLKKTLKFVRYGFNNVSKDNFNFSWLKSQYWTFINIIQQVLIMINVNTWHYPDNANIIHIVLTSKF